MEAVLFIGMQASGKSTFYRERFFSSHVRINLDMLRTRHREKRLLEVCLDTKQPFIVDNTNPTKLDRQAYISSAKEAGFRIVGYYFQSSIEDCKRRNEQRTGEQQVPLLGLLGTYSRLEIPCIDEGFDQLFYVRIADDGFVVEEWKNEV